MNIKGSRLKNLFLSLLRFLGIKIKAIDSKIVFKICYKFYLKYLETKPVIELES